MAPISALNREPCLQTQISPDYNNFNSNWCKRSGRTHRWQNNQNSQTFPVLQTTSPSPTHPQILQQKRWCLKSKVVRSKIWYHIQLPMVCSCSIERLFGWSRRNFSEEEISNRQSITVSPPCQETINCSSFFLSQLKYGNLPNPLVD